MKEAEERERKAKQDQEVNRAIEQAVTKMIQQDGYDLDKILADIKNANSNDKQDLFTEKKAFVVCNSQYSDKTGLGDLLATKNDLASIKRTISMIGIEKENQIILEDTNLTELTE